MCIRDRYLSYFYGGGYGQNAKRMEELLAYAKDEGLRLSGEPFEMYEIDNRDTVREEMCIRDREESGR